MMLPGILVIAILLAVLVNRWAGRLAALSAAAACGFAMAYFLMPPLFSFRVSQTEDCVALGLYGAVALLVARPGRRKDTEIHGNPELPAAKRKRSSADLAAALRALMLTDLGTRLAELNPSAPNEPFTLPCTQEDLQLVMRDILRESALDPDVKRISFSGSQRPGVRRLVIAAHRLCPPPPDQIIVIGKRDRDCDLMESPDWPANIRVTWFDTGVDRIFQLSVFAE